MERHEGDLQHARSETHTNTRALYHCDHPLNLAVLVCTRHSAAFNRRVSTDHRRISDWKSCRIVKLHDDVS